MSINCWLSKTKHDNPFADNLLSSEMIAINQGYRYLGHVQNGWLSTCGLLAAMADAPATSLARSHCISYTLSLAYTSTRSSTSTRRGHAMKPTRRLEGLWQAAVTVTLLLTCSVSSWGQTSRDNAPGGSPAACYDTTPHHVTFVEVEPGVQLEVLDWGGAHKPQTMVLLTGLGDNAHVYDQFAFQFTEDFHVIGMTRRGFLPSSQPEDGYDV